jgi:hypothetical protein
MIFRFCYKIVFFLLIPILSLIVLENILPAQLFTFRGYEALLFNSSVPHLGNFYSNKKMYKYAEGDLCHHTSYSVKKHEFWITDNLGFRNDTFIQQPDILFLGNSFFYGTGSSQNQIISNRVSSLLNGKYKVYNMAPSTWGELDSYLNKGLIKKPQIIIYPISEIHVPAKFRAFEKEQNFLAKEIIREIFYTGLNEPIDKSIRLYSLNWIKSRLNGIKNFGVKTNKSGAMFFAQGEKMYRLSEYEIIQSVEAIKTYKHYCDSLGIKFLYLPTPNKETVYYDFIPFDTQPDYYIKLKNELSKESIDGINTLDIFNNFRKHNTKLLYHLDDTHWNSLGVELLSKEIAKYIIEEIKLKPYPTDR